MGNNLDYLGILCVHRLLLTRTILTACIPKAARAIAGNGSRDLSRLASVTVTVAAHHSGSCVYGTLGAIVIGVGITQARVCFVDGTHLSCSFDMQGTYFWNNYDLSIKSQKPIRWEQF